MNRVCFTLTGWVIAVLTFNCGALTHYVDLNRPSPVPPYTSWLTAATNIQDAVDAADAGDTVLVTNGVYATGGRAIHGTMTNRVVVDKPLMLVSVNGPDFTAIEGHQVLPDGYGPGAIRCVYLTNGATLCGFTLTGGGTEIGSRDDRLGWGAGLWCESTEAYASNCVITNCVAEYAAGGAVRGTLDNCTITATVGTYGGGARESILNHCLLTFNEGRSYGGGAAFGILNRCLVISNSAYSAGGAQSCPMTNCLVYGNSAVHSKGGAMWGPLVNCTVVRNSAGSYAGGVMHGTHYNCIIYDNEAPTNPNFDPQYTTLFNCASTPIANPGTGNITNAPLFVSTNGWSDLRLHSNSPCINAGNNAYVTSTTDLDANLRISGGTVDMGAYEFQSPGSVLSYAWAQQYGLPTDGTADFEDPDGEGADNYHEWRSDTVPTNAASALWMSGVSNGAAGLSVSWQSVPTRSYWLDRAEDLGASPVFQTIATNIPGVAGTTTFNDASATNGGPYFYRVGVQ